MATTQRTRRFPSSLTILITIIGILIISGCKPGSSSVNVDVDILANSTATNLPDSIPVVEVFDSTEETISPSIEAKPTEMLLIETPVNRT